MESVLTFHYLSVPVGRALIFHTLYKVVSYYFLQIFNFVASFTTFTSFHIIPFPRQSGHLYTRFRCTIWEAVCGWVVEHTHTAISFKVLMPALIIRLTPLCCILKESLNCSICCNYLQSHLYQLSLHKLFPLMQCKLLSF